VGLVKVRRRPGGAALAVALVLAACNDPHDAALVDAVCEALAAERTLPPGLESLRLPPRQNFAVTLSMALAGSQPGEAAEVVAYLDPAASASLDEVADELAAIDGVEVVEVLDQQAAYVEFVELFAASDPELVESVAPAALPTSVVVKARDDDALETVEAFAESDERVREVITDRVTVELVGQRAGTVVDLFDGEVDELLAAGGLPRDAATAVLRLDAASATLDHVEAARTAVGELLDEAADGCDLDPPR
jgi:hypothetical protein